jgi:predicted AAA+ superfamily ATPase
MTQTISIIGMGRLGKTTLAKKIYNDDRVKGHFKCYVWLYVSQDFETTKFFLEIDETLEDMGVEKLKEKLVKDLQGKKYIVVLDDIWKIKVWNEVKIAFPPNNDSVKSHFSCRAWVCVTQYFSLKELLLQILTSHLPISNRDDLTKMVAGMSNNELQNKYLKEQLVKHLKGKRYLIVMDDIWSTEVWDEVQHAFPKNGNGSRILVISRIKKVTSHANHIFDPYVLPFLSQDESWELLRK